MIGRTFLGRYEIMRLLGEGGMGQVYLARQIDLGRQVVVKIMHDHIAREEKFRERFQRETILMARFHHPNAVTLYDASLNDPAGPCIVMEYIKGINLEKLLEKVGRLSSPRAARILAQLCDVLDAAHEAGFIHRDLKPANLMVLDAETPKERIKVMDFGLAKLIDQPTTSRVTDTNVDFAVGTPAYICPEQVRGEPMDHRGDIYSVGIMAYELLTGRVPFQGPTGMDVLLAHATEDPPTFADLGLDQLIPAGLETLIRRCLAKNPDERPQSAREFADAFALVVEEQKNESGSGTTRWFEANQAETKNIVWDDSIEEPISLRPGQEQSIADMTRTTSSVRPENSRSRSAVIEPKLGKPSLPFQFDAWMPETIAFMKLRGFVQDHKGEVLESSSGFIRVRLRPPQDHVSKSWFGLGRRGSGTIDLTLKMNRSPEAKDNHVAINVDFYPAYESLLADRDWRDRCGKIFVELRAYLMGGF